MVKRKFSSRGVIAIFGFLGTVVTIPFLIFRGLVGLVGRSGKGMAAPKTAKRNMAQSVELETVEREHLERASALMKQATACKDFEIERAIALLREAVNICPNFAEASFKLARYLRKSGSRDESFGILRKMSTNVDANDLLSCNFAHEAIYEEMMKQLFEEKKFNYYLYYFFQRVWCKLCALASQGRYEGFDEDIFFRYGEQSKVEKTLKELGQFEKREEIGAIVYEELKRFDPLLQRMSDISKSLKPASSSDSTVGESIGQRKVRALRANAEYMSLFGTLCDPTIPDELFNNHLREYFVDRRDQG